MTVARSVADVLAEHVNLEVECIDRMYLNVYQPRLQHVNGAVWFFRGHRGATFASSALMDPISKTFLATIRRDLAAHPGMRVLAYWRRPRYPSGAHHGGDASSQPWWAALRGHRVVVLNGHEHNYERFADKGGIREFVAGTGGSANYPFGSPAPGSEVRITKTPGILRLDLGSGYAWRFVTRTGVKDSGRSS